MAVATTPTGAVNSGRTSGWQEEVRAGWRAIRSWYPLLLVALALAAVTLVYQSPQTLVVHIGGGYDAPYLRGFYDREGSGVAAFRWASARARVELPGAGARDSTLVITAGARPDGMPEPVSIVVNGISLGQFVPAPTPTEFSFPLPARDYSFGNLTVDLISVGQPIRTRGSQALIYGPRVTNIAVVADGASGLVKPPIQVALAWALAAPLLYLLLLRIGTPRRYAVAVGLAFVAGLAALTLARRLDLAIFAPRLAFLIAAAYALAVLAEHTLPQVFARAGVRVSKGAWRLLLLLFLFVYLLKLGGIAYPQLIVIDQPWHDQQFQKVLLGRFWEIYRPNNSGISGIPGQWGINAQIPYSPFLYVLGLPFYLWPVGRDLSISFWSGLFDTSRVFVLFFLARLLGAHERGALFAAFIIGLTPSTFLLHSWGNYPTTISLYVALLFVTVLVAKWDSLRRPRTFVLLSVLLVLAMLLYTVTAVFLGLFLLALLATIPWRGNEKARQAIAPVALLLALSALLAFFGFYVQYVDPLLNATLPAFRAELAAGRSLGGTTPPASEYAARYIANLWHYGVLLSLLAVPAGWIALARRPRHPAAAPLLAAWFAVFVFFAIAGAKIDMVSKEVWFVLPAVAICAGVAIDGWLTRWPGRIAKLASGLFFWQLAAAGLLLWAVRIATVRH